MKTFLLSEIPVFGEQGPIQSLLLRTVDVKTCRDERVKIRIPPLT